eukprot:m.222708 g.222708  ORF g.222708 m.222708 type:complete len:50 (-) comp33380_c1_seq6:4592-4741(-)
MHLMHNTTKSTKNRNKERFASCRKKENNIKNQSIKITNKNTLKSNPRPI